MLIRILLFLIGYFVFVGLFLFWFHAAMLKQQYDETIWEKIMKELTQRKNR